MYVSSFNDIMVTNRNMVQYKKDKRYDCWIVRLNLCKTLGIKLYIAPLQETTTKRRSQPSHGHRRRTK